jgi:serine/threonine protein phosphatase PrpC
VADGAGGRSGGAEAASMAVELVRRNASLVNDAESCSEVLCRIDAAIAKDPIAGETTCALVIVTPEEIFGASVGDSNIWLIPENGAHVDLTRAQQRKPFIGSGSAWPVPYQHPMQGVTLLLATDGLSKYTSAERIIATCRVSNHSPPGTHLGCSIRREHVCLVHLRAFGLAASFGHSTADQHPRDRA